MSSLLNLKEAKQLFYGGNELDRVYLNGELIWDRPSEAMWRLWSETQGLAIDFTDGFYYNSTARFGTVAIKDTTTPANNLDSVPDDKLSYPGASVKYTRDMDGVIRYRPHNLWPSANNYAANVPSFASGATASGNVISLSSSTGFIYRGTGSALLSGAVYAVTLKATCSITATVTFRIVDNDGVAVYGSTNASMTAGVQQTITFNFTATNALPLIVGVDQRFGGSNLTGATVTLADVQLRRTPSPDVFVNTTGAARICLPYEWGATNLFASPSSPATQTITGLTVGRKYTVYCEGSGAIALSGAGKGTATASAPRTFKAATTSVVCTVSGSLTVVHVREALGIRQESARTNLLLRSRMTAGAVAGTPGTAPTSWPFGGNGGTTTIETSGGLFGNGYLRLAATSARQYLDQQISVAANTTYRLTLLANVRTVQLFANSFYAVGLPAGATLTGWTSNGVATTENDPTPSGQVRLEFTLTTVGTAGTANIRIGVGCAGATTGDIDLYLAQAEAGSTASTPIETFGSTVTRATDRPELLTSAFPFNSSAFTIVARWRLASFVTTDSQSALSLSVDNNNRVTLTANNSAGSASALVVSGGATQGFSDITPPITAGPVFAQGFAIELNNSAHVINGGSPVVDAAVLMPSGITKLLLGTGATGFNPLEGWLSDILFLPRRVSNAELQSLTAA
jgi:hypothetical protein